MRYVRSVPLHQAEIQTTRAKTSLVICERDIEAAALLFPRTRSCFREWFQHLLLHLHERVIQAL